jgi:hypothetical protein
MAALAVGVLVGADVAERAALMQRLRRRRRSGIDLPDA